jgi:hypothetical protein
VETLETRRCTHGKFADDWCHQCEGFPYVYRWNRHGKKDWPCKVTARGAMNSCRVEFPDGYKMITSRNAIKKAK